MGHGRKYKFLRYVTRLLIPEILQRVCHIDMRPEMLMHKVGGHPR